MWTIGKEAVCLCFVHVSLMSGMVATWNTDIIYRCMSGVLGEDHLITRTEYLKKRSILVEWRNTWEVWNVDMGELVGYLQETGELRSWIKAVSMRMKKGTRFERELKTDKPCIQWYGAEGHIYKDKNLFLPSLKSQHLSTSSFAYTCNTIESLEKAKNKTSKIPLFLWNCKYFILPSRPSSETNIYFS